MKAQSLSVVVPNKRCINDCAFCVSKMSANTYKNQMDDMGKRDCTAEENTEENYKYLILRPDCKLYSAWDDPASLIF